jgi:hypothetical protein
MTLISEVHVHPTRLARREKMIKNTDGRGSVPLANQVRAFNTLGSVLAKLEDGRVVYKEGWNDDKVAQDAQISPGHVAAIRRKNFGSLARQPEKETKRKRLRDDFEAMKALIDHNAAQVRILTTEVQSIWRLLEEKTNA